MLVINHLATGKGTSLPGRILPIIRNMSYEEMLQAVNNTCDVHVDDTVTLPSDTLTGVYDETLKTILIDQRMTDVQKRCTLTHELIHWAHGDQGCGNQIGRQAEHRTQQETAKTLINPIAYQQAEQECDADPYQIACQLDVTLSVVNTYREMLHSGMISSR